MEIEQKYKSVDDREHVLLRGGMYIGNIRNENRKEYVMLEDEGVIREKDVVYSPAVLKLVDEIISNSVDEHRKNLRDKTNQPLNKIVVDIDETGIVSVWDNGGIPVVIHKDEGCYLPQMLFGKMKSSSNYNDDEERSGVGTNGVGSALVNCYSTQFKVETCDEKNHYTQVWKNNMLNVGDPKIKTSKQKYTKITYKLDLKKLTGGVTYDLMSKVEMKCILAAASNPKLKVVFKDRTYQFKDFKNYVELYGYNVVGESNKDWTYYVAAVPTIYGGKTMSLINGAECNQGSHIEYINSVVRDIANEHLKKKHKFTMNLTHLKKHFISFVCANIKNPEYDSQTKEKLTSEFRITQGDKQIDRLVSTKFKKQLIGSDLIDFLVEWNSSSESAAETKQVDKISKELYKKSTRNIEKLVDVNISRGRDKAELWVFEGDSASQHFRSTRNTKTQASYSLKGKVKNTLDMTTLDVVENKELSEIIMSMGLKPNDPDDISGLRFGRLIIATDMDVDGYCICGQFTTFIMTHYPELIRQGKFFRAISPLIKAKKGKQEKVFYSLDEFDKFSNKTKGWSHDYYKGLGSLEKLDYREMLSNPKLEQLTMDTDYDFDVVQKWMGKDSDVKKEMLMGTFI